MNNESQKEKGLAYAGIGSRKTPDEILSLMVRLAKVLKSEGYLLRSGGAGGADSAFEKGAGSHKEIFLPWSGFNGNRSRLFDIPYAAFSITSSVHPAWSYLKDAVKKLHARNAQQVLGKNLNSRVVMVICWTPGGEFTEGACTDKTGGTGTAIKIAARNNIPVFNLAYEPHLKRIQKYIKSKENRVKASDSLAP